MRKLALCGLLLLTLPGCTASFNWPASLPQLFKVTWTELSVSWIVIAAGLVAYIVVNKVKRMIANAGKKETKNDL